MEHFSKYKLVADDDSDSEGEGENIKGGDSKRKKVVSASEKGEGENAKGGDSKRKKVVDASEKVRIVGMAVGMWLGHGST